MSSVKSAPRSHAEANRAFTLQLLEGAVTRGRREADILREYAAHVLAQAEQLEREAQDFEQQLEQEAA